MRPKFSAVTSKGAQPSPYVWQPLYERNESNGKHRLTVAVASSGIDLILKLVAVTPEPFGILYVLVVPRGTQPGRFQLKHWLDRGSLDSFLEQYRKYFEGDGRHDIWIKPDDDSLIVYDRHEILYLYGELDDFCRVLENQGYDEGNVRVDFAHEHHYNHEFDSEQFSIVDSGDYTRFDLVSGQDYESDDPRPD